MHCKHSYLGHFQVKAISMHEDYERGVGGRFTGERRDLMDEAGLPVCTTFATLKAFLVIGRGFGKRAGPRGGRGEGGITLEPSWS